MTTDGMLRSQVDPAIAIDPALVGRVVEELFPEALGVWIYGSFADGSARADSDIDIAILPGAPLDSWSRFERAQDVAGELHREVDLVDLTRVSDLLRYEALSPGIRVAARDPSACDRFELVALAKYSGLRDELRAWVAEIGERGTVY